MSLFNYYPTRNETDPQKDKKIAKHSLLFSSFLLFCFWLVLIVEKTLDLQFYRAGIYPLHLKGLPGILLAPFIHAGYKHLLANSFPFWILCLTLIYFYRKLGYLIFFLLYLMSGLLLWFCGREAWHIGCSGVIYGMASFLFFSGIFRSDARLLTIALIVAFLYGSLFWGLFPLDPSVSWEGHLWGAVSGLFLSLFYRGKGPRRTHYEWENEDDQNENSGNDLPAELTDEKPETNPLTENSRFPEHKKDKVFDCPNII